MITMIDRWIPLQQNRACKRRASEGGRMVRRVARASLASVALLSVYLPVCRLSRVGCCRSIRWSASMHRRAAAVRVRVWCGAGMLLSVRCCSDHPKSFLIALAWNALAAGRVACAAARRARREKDMTREGELRRGTQAEQSRAQRRVSAQHTAHRGARDTAHRSAHHSSPSSSRPGQMHEPPMRGNNGGRPG